MSGWDHAWPAFLLGAALATAPGPVQLLILAESSKGGLGRGMRVMLGANLTFLAIAAAIALGFSAVTPSEGALRILRLAGGALLVWIAVVELRQLRREGSGVVDARDPGIGSSFGPTLRGVLCVVVNPGAWIFFATTASAVAASANADGGRSAALLAALTMAIGVSVTDFAFVLLGSGGRALVGDRGMRWVRGVLAVLLLGIGLWFVVAGIRG